MSQVGIESITPRTLDNIPMSNSGRNLKTWWNFEDFLCSDNLASGIWEGNSSGAGAVATGSPGSYQRPGQVTGTTGTTNAGRACVYGSSNTADGIIFGLGQYTFETDIYLPVLSAVAEEFTFTAGFGESTNADQVDGAYFYYDRLGAGVNWRLKTAQGSTRTDTDSGVAVAAAVWIRLKVVVNYTGTSVSYYINNVLVGTLTTNIPVAGGQQTAFLVNMLKTAGVTPRTWLIDWAWIHIDLTASR